MKFHWALGRMAMMHSTGIRSVTVAAVASGVHAYCRLVVPCGICIKYVWEERGLRRGGLGGAKRPC